MKKLIIQFIAADTDPQAGIQVDKEYQAILRQVKPHGNEKHSLFAAPAARLEDVRKALQWEKPNCVHFSAHGTPLSRILLFNEHDKLEAISHQTIGLLFNALRERIRLVTLSYCFSRDQALKMIELIDCVIGIERTITPEAATAYAAALYGQLASGESVGRAHQLACITISKFDLPPESRPVLLYRDGVDPFAVFPGSQAASTLPRKNRKYMENKRAFERNQKKYKVWADELSVVKTCYRDGSSVLSYEIRNLQSSEQGLRKIYFDVESVAGLVVEPKIDSRGTNLNLEWKSSPAPVARTIRGVIDQIRTVRGNVVGNFHFTHAAANTSKGYSFGWTLPVMNSDALTSWEYNNLYPPQSQTHVDGRRLRSRVEYFASLVWFPVKRISVQVNVPPSISQNPRFQYYRLKKKKQRGIPTTEIFSSQTLYLRPNPKSRWRKTNARWDMVSNVEVAETYSFAHQPDGSNKLIVDYPTVGSYFSIDWEVPDPEVARQFHPLIREAEVVREQLIVHRACRESGRKNNLSDEVAQLFLKLHNQIRNTYGTNHPTECFETTLLTWDQVKNRLVVVEGFINGREISDKAWDFWLPFGLGLGGACFRKADAQTYKRPLDKRDQVKKENYLPLPGSPPHECLLVLHIDHPKLDQTNVPDLGRFRSRQLIGVVTVGSTYGASRLCPLCELAEASKNSEPKSIASDIQADIKKMDSLRNECQETCDRIALLLLNRA